MGIKQVVNFHIDITNVLDSIFLLVTILCAQRH